MGYTTRRRISSCPLPRLCPKRLHVCRSLLAPMVGWLFTTSVCAAPPGGDGWKYDIVHLKNNKSLSGLVVEQGPLDIVLKCVWRRPGRPTIVIRESVPRREIAR